MRKSTPILLLCCFVACDLDSTEPDTRERASQLAVRAEWQASITPTGTQAVSGTIKLREYRAYYDADLSITGLPNRTYNWRIHPGTCANSQTTVFGGSTQAYPAFVTDAAGSAKLTRLMAGALDSVAAYNVRIMTGTAITTTVACGNLQRS